MKAAGQEPAPEWDAVFIYIDSKNTLGTHYSAQSARPLRPSTRTVAFTPVREDAAVADPVEIVDGHISARPDGSEAFSAAVTKTASNADAISRQTFTNAAIFSVVSSFIYSPRFTSIITDFTAGFVW